jgi:hypothetical protein
MMDRLNTKALMQRKNWHLEEGNHCILCDTQEVESRDHLFFTCPYAANVWTKLHIQWDNSLPISAKIIKAKSLFHGPCFMEIFMCASWNLWKDRNDFIFRDENATFARWKVRFLSDLQLHRYRVKDSLVQPLLDWILSWTT